MTPPEPMDRSAKAEGDETKMLDGRAEMDAVRLLAVAYRAEIERFLALRADFAWLRGLGILERVIAPCPKRGGCPVAGH